MSTGGDYCTEDRVSTMITKAFAEYEERVGDVRHRDNTKNFEILFALMNKMLGGFTAAKIIGALLAFLLTVTITLLGIALTRREEGHSALSTIAPTIAQVTTAEGW